jgi:hypothetical protein
VVAFGLRATATDCAQSSCHGIPKTRTACSFSACVIWRFRHVFANGVALNRRLGLLFHVHRF